MEEQTDGQGVELDDSASRFRRVAEGLTRTIAAVPPDAWQQPSPCPGWTCTDVVRHLVTWIPGPGFLLGSFGVDTAPLPSVDHDPAGAWAAARDAIQDALDDPAVAARVADCGPAGTLSLCAAVDMTCSPDVLIHTWDLARGAGIEPCLDDREVARQAASIDDVPSAVDEAMRASGHFGPRPPVPAGADDLTRLLAFYGRTVD